MFDFKLRYKLIYQFSKLARDEAHALSILHGFTDDVIKKRRQELLEHVGESMNAEQDAQIGIRKKRAFLDILLQSTIDGKPLTDLEIREEVDTFLFEGHDTTTSAITFCLYNIAKYPEVQKKVRKEVDDVFGMDRREPATLAKLNELTYLELVIKETLRLYPSVPIIGRLATEDIELSESVYKWKLVLTICGVQIHFRPFFIFVISAKNRIVPKGSNVLIPILPIHYNEEVFDEPREFRPERFLEERTTATVNPFAYVPFSGRHIWVIKRTHLNVFCFDF